MANNSTPDMGALSLVDRPEVDPDVSASLADLVNRCQILNDEVGEYITVVSEKQAKLFKVERPVEHRSLRTVSDS